MSRPARPLLALALGAALAAPAAAQTTYTWDGSDNNSWATPGNFSPTPPPGGFSTDFDRVVFEANGLINPNQSQVTDPMQLLTELNGSYTLGGVAVGELQAAAVPTISIAAGTLGAAANNALNLNGFGSFGFDLRTANRNLAVSSRVNLLAAQSWSVAGLRTLTVTGVVTGGPALALNVNGSFGTAGMVVLTNGLNAFAGTTVTSRGGVLRLDSATALAGAAGLVLNPLSDNNPGTATDRAVVSLNNVGAVDRPLTLSAAGDTLRGALRAEAGAANDWSGPIALAGVANTAHEFEAVTAATTLTISGDVTGAFAGTLFLQGAGTGNFTPTAAINLPSATLRKATASLWTVDSPNNVLARVTVDAGTLRIGAANAVGTSAVATLGQAGTVADLDLNGRNQAVGGLATDSTDALVNPAGNRIGIGNLVAGPGVESTLTYGGIVSSYKGTLVDSLTAATGRTLSLTVQSGSLTLGATNTYSGPTLINGGTLGLTTVTGIVGGVTNNGAIANSSSVTLNAQAARLDVTGLAGGANPGPSSDGTAGRFLVAANQTLQGIGTAAQGGGVIGGVTVSPLGTLRGGLPGNVASPLTVTGGVELRGGTAGDGDGQLVIDLDNTATSGDPVGRVAAGGVFNLATPGPVVIKLENDQNLVNGTSYNFAVAAAIGGFQLNGTPLGAGEGYTYLTDFTLVTDRPQTGSFQGVTLIPDGSNNLILTFTPVPEPATVLGLAALGLGAVRLARRRILAG